MANAPTLPLPYAAQPYPTLPTLHRQRRPDAILRYIHVLLFTQTILQRCVVGVTHHLCPPAQLCCSQSDPPTHNHNPTNLNQKRQNFSEDSCVITPALGGNGRWNTRPLNKLWRHHMYLKSRDVHGPGQLRRVVTGGVVSTDTTRSVRISIP